MENPSMKYFEHVRIQIRLCDERSEAEAEKVI
jgi:hypothetical protein